MHAWTVALPRPSINCYGVASGSIGIESLSVCNQQHPTLASWGHADLDLKGEKFPCVKHGTVLGKYSHVINMGLL